MSAARGNLVKTLFIIFAFAMFPQRAYTIESVDFFSGKLSADLEEESAYEAVPFLFSFNYKPSRLLSGIGMPEASRLTVEPFLIFLSEPGGDMEAGVNLMLQYPLPAYKKIRPYLKAGVGVVYMTRETIQQKSGFNFLPQAGIGFSLRSTAKVDLCFEYRFRHLSNAGIRKPNRGIDADMLLAGIRIRI